MNLKFTIKQEIEESNTSYSVDNYSTVQTYTRLYSALCIQCYITLDSNM